MTTRWWDDERACFVTGESVWTGKGAMPWELAGSEYWAQKEGPEVGGFERGRSDIPGKEEMRRKGPPADMSWRDGKAPEASRRCGCGRLIRVRHVNRGLTSCELCRALIQKKKPLPQPGLCIACGAVIPPAYIRCGYVRCKSCRRADPTVQTQGEGRTRCECGRKMSAPAVRRGYLRCWACRMEAA